MHKLKDHNAEMRWLAELLPLDTKVTVQLAEQRLSEWCDEHPQDARALAHLGNVTQDEVLFEKASSMGDSWAMGMCAYCCLEPSYDVQFRLALASAKKGDANGTYSLALLLREGLGCEKNERFAAEMLEYAAELGKPRRDA